MDLLNEFVVPLNVEEAWVLLTDVDRIAPCMPGASLESHVGDKFTGRIKIKIGPVTPTFTGEAFFLERDEYLYRAVLSVDGRETRGQGFAKGTITASLFRVDDHNSKVIIESHLQITGRMASFGRNVVGDISNKLFQQFVMCLERDLLSGGSNGRS